MEKLVLILVNKMEQQELISANQRESYLYVLQMKLEGLVSIFCILILSFALKMVIPTIFFLLAVTSLKKRCGGFHASTFTQCLVSTLIIYVFFVQYLLGFMLCNMKTTFYYFFTAFLFVELVGAVNHPNMNWSRAEYMQSKRLARMTAFIETLVIILLLVLKADSTIIVFLMFATMLSAILMLLEIIFNSRRYLYEKINGDKGITATSEISGKGGKETKYGT